ncbi:MAG: lysophospholipase [Bacteroidetes bacterium]|nr:MAG: lysophospholipase [Bacteroidota bacterium]
MNTYGETQTLHYLALGDSYTIGESVFEKDRFPEQTVGFLRKSGIQIDHPRIIAKTGWTTDELAAAIESANIQDRFDIVSLLIGVNNQYRGRSVEDYASQFEDLCKIALSFAGNVPSKVYVLSIPDWGLTPFAEGRDRKLISSQIDAFNDVNKKIAEKYQFNYIDITTSYRRNINDPTSTASDGLHPSAKAYQIWAELLAEKISKNLIGKK